jgi:hypothetical protein
MTHLDLIPDALSLLGALALTWPALRAGHVLTRAAAMARGEKAATSMVSKNIFRRLQAAYLAESWRRSDQGFLWIGLGLTLLGGVATLVSKWHAPLPSHL